MRELHSIKVYSSIYRLKGLKCSHDRDLGRSVSHIRKSLVSVVPLLSGCFANAQDKAPIHVVILAAPEQIKNAAIAMFARNGYTLDSLASPPWHTASQLKISKPFSEGETVAYNTAHWTNQPVENCRHVQAFLLSPVDEETSVTMTTWMVRNTDEYWLIRADDDQKEIQRAQNVLADLKAKVEGIDKRTRR